MRSADAAAEIETYASLESLPDDAGLLFAAAETMFSSRIWWRTVQEDAMPPDAVACFVLCRIDRRPAGLFPMLRNPGLSGFTTPYTCCYQPLIAPDVDAVAVFTAFAGYCRSSSPFRIDSLPAEWPLLGAMTEGARRAGLLVRRFDHFGNWYEKIEGLDWAGYVASRPGALRETIRRRLRRAERIADARFRLVSGPVGLEQAIADFESVYARSWKEPEPFPRFNAALMRGLAPLGLLRLAIWSIGEQPVAAQFWIVEHGKATVLKLAHDEAFKAYSPGTVLTALTIRHLLDQDHVVSLDFGRGDDPYKRDWASYRRRRVGLMLINPWRPAGWAALLRHDIGRARAWLRRRRGLTPLAPAQSSQAGQADPQNRE